MKRKSKHKIEVLLAISDATISPQLLEIIKCLKNNGVTQHVLITVKEDCPLLSGIEDLDVPFQIMPNLSKFGLLFRSIQIFFIIFSVRPKNFLASGQYATISGIPPAFLLRVKNRIYIRHHSNFHHKYGMRMGVLVDIAMNFLSTKIVAVSSIVSNVLTEREFVSSEKVVLIYNGVDLKRFQKPTSVSKDRDDFFRIGVISRLTELKGIEYTAKAFSDFNFRYPRSLLHIIGASSDSLPKVLSILEKLSPESYCIESINYDIPEFLHSIDVLVHVPLEPDDEAFGIVYIEALASGTTGVFTISGVLNELENPDQYFAIVPSRDSSAIFKELLQIHEGTNEFEKIPPAWINQFAIESQGLAYLKLLS